MSMKIEIVNANVQMCKELALIKRQVWESTYRGIYPDIKFDDFNVDNETEKFVNMLNNPKSSLYVALVDNKIVGYMAIGKSPRRIDVDYEEIVLLYILKDFQGLGIGKQFFDIAKEKLKKQNTDYFIVYCNKYNYNAQNFYKKMGCEVISVDDDNIDKSLPQIKFIYRY